MEFIKLFNDTMEDDKNMIGIIDETTKQIKNLISHNLFFDSKNTSNVKCNIQRVMRFWVNAEPGTRKCPILSKYFQCFYNSLLHLLIKNRKFKYLYKGTIYRYLGNFSNSNDLLSKIEYNDIYVSWSKNENVIKCIEYKLIPPYIKLTAVIDKDKSRDFYGIDLEKFGIIKYNEEEVVYPTILKDVTDAEVYK